jgi:hypothetical protein
MKLRFLVVGLALTLLLSGTVMAKSSAQSYDISWWTVDGGGSAIAGGSYALHSTIGQPDAGELAGGNYALAGGFWHGVPVIANYELYLPLVVRNAS